MDGQSQIVIEGVNHTYRPPRGRTVLALSDVSLQVRPREFQLTARIHRRLANFGFRPYQHRHNQPGLHGLQRTDQRHNITGVHDCSTNGGEFARRIEK